MRQNNRSLLFFTGTVFSLVSWFAFSKPNPHFRVQKNESETFLADSSDEDTLDNVKYKPSRKPTYKEKEQYEDYLKNKERKRSPLILDRPKAVKTEVELDPSGQYYNVNEKLGDIDFKPGTIMTFDQYKKFQSQQAAKNYYRQKSKESDDKAAAKKDKPRALIPRIYINPNLDRIFGGNYIDVKLNGSVLLDFGYRIQVTNNPAIAVNQRSIGGFYFDQNIAMNAQAKIGERLKITINQDTKSQFDFDNNVKIEYTALETDIVQKVEAGNVSMPLNTSLIQGAQNLFGAKAILKFGRLQVTAIAAQQRGRGQETRLQGGAQGRDFSVRADNYEDNRHYFLGQFFRNNYESSLVNAPQITSGINVTRVEVWITNRNNTTENLRNAIGFMDLGEQNPHNKLTILPRNVRDGASANEANTLFSDLEKSAGENPNIEVGIRKADNSSFILEGAPFSFKNGDDFEVMRNCRKLKDSEFKFHPQLGYISLNAAVGRDDVIGVSFEYSYLGTVYKVGELTEDYTKLDSKQAIFVKLLRPSTIRTDVPMWDLQMKNIYSLQASNISRENFQLRVVYRDDRTQLNTPVLKNDPTSIIDGKPLIQVLQLDKLNMSNDPQPDGNFDFIESAVANPVQPIQNTGTNPTPGGIGTNSNDATATSNNNINNQINTNRITAITIDPVAGRVIFPVLEPFGKTLKQGFQEDTISRPELINKYVYNELYRKTKADALQLSNKNKFFIIGRYQATASDEIPITGFAGGGIADSRFVKVSSGGQLLTENVDYIVQPNGTVKIINPSLLLPGKDISVRYESPDLFQVRSKFFTGARLDYVLNKDIAFGATLLNLNERPLISRVAIGDEPVNNTVWGFDGTYKSDSRLITQIVDKLPFYSTKEKSTIQASGEFAQLIAGAPALVTKNGEPTFFLDDFESTQLPFRLDNSPWLNWRLASTPPNFEGLGYSASNPLPLGYKRAKIAWYAIDQSFYRSENSNGQNAADLKNNYVRPVLPQAIFPGRDRQQLQLNEPIFDIAYFPTERGTYNYNPNLNADGTLPNPENNWGGITRAVNNYDTDFDNANYQYLEFWLMDPFLKGNNGKVLDGKFNKSNETGGKVFFNLGSISEDVLKDGKQSFEQGLPTNGQKPGPEVDNSPWGFVTNQPYINNAFQNEGGARANQDVGLDGLKDEEERQKFSNYVEAINSRVTVEEAKNKILNDPSNDNFQYFLGADQDEAGKKILERYKAFNGPEGNSPDNSSNSSGFNASSYSTPDNEDINQNNTLNDLEEFFQYELDLRPNQLEVGKNFVVNSVTEVVPETGENVNWYLVRIPLREGFTKFGNIQNFKSVRFLRTYLTGWKEPVVLRMAQMQLVASQWRPFVGDLSEKGLKEVIEPNDQVFTVSTVNTEENSQGSATNKNVSPYVVPPGYQRDNDVNSLTPRRLNEHSLRLCVDGLPDQDARAVFKNMGGLSLINYNKVKMFVHAEADPQFTADNDLTVFMRFGSDFTDNYYEIEMPLKLTNPALTYDPNLIWRSDNWFDIDLNELWELKLQRDRETGDLFGIFPAYQKTNARSIYIRGNPSYTNLQTIMIGVRNPKSPDKQPKSVCIWVNELRVAGIKQSDGIAATARANIKLADLGNVSATMKYTGAGFGGLEQKVSQRLQENTMEFGVNTNIQVEKLIPKNEKIGLRLPMYASYDNKNISPKFDPTNPDVPTVRSVENKEIISPGSGSDYATLIQDNTRRRSISFNNISKVKTKPNAKKYIFDIENLSVSLGYSDIKRSNVNIQNYDSKNYKAGIGYNYAPKPLNFEPFKKSTGIMKSEYLKLIKDFNLNPIPNSISIRGDLDRTITQTQYSNGILSGRHDTLGIPPNFEKRFLFNRNYALGWGITKSIQFNYNALVNAIVDEPAGGFSGYTEIRPGFSRSDSVVKNLQNGGRMKNFNQKVGLNYKLPLDKFPATNWLSADARYTASYTWTAGPYRNPDNVKLGNNAQNTRDITLNGKADFVKFYDKIKFLKSINASSGKPTPKVVASKKDTSKVKPPPELNGLKGVLRFLMMVRSVNVTYQRTNGTVLPGFLGTPKYFGLDESIGGRLDESFLPFILGDQSSSVYKNEKFANSYFSQNRLITERITQNQTENITGRANIEPFKDFRIQLDVKLTNTVSFQERFAPQFDTVNNIPIFTNFASQNPYKTGSYSISYLTIETFFEEDWGKKRTSPAFSQFETNRQTIVDRLNKENPNVGTAKYDTSSQDALIPAFLSAYTRTSADKISLTSFPKIPLPNWRIDYAGLPNLFPALKEIFPSISITHSYSNTYNVSSYSSSLKYGGDTIGINRFANPVFPTISDSSGILVPINIINQVSITERFAPLLGLNFKTKGNMNFRIEYTADRALNFTIQNRQITETRNEGITIGYGYTKANFKLPVKWQGREVVLKNDITFRVDLSRKESTTVLRRIDGPALITQGQVNFNIRPNIAYQVNQRLTTQLYFEYTLIQPKVSTSFTRTVFAFGLQLRYSLS